MAFMDMSGDSRSFGKEFSSWFNSGRLIDRFAMRWTFYRLLHGRGVTLKKLAAAADSSVTHLSQVFCGHRGAKTRQRLFPLLTEDEVRSLGWTEEYNRWRGSTG